MKALRLKAWKSEPVLDDVAIPEPGAGEVVVQVGAAGACHSDLHLMYDFEAGTLPWSPPFTLGHENAGWVHAVGAGVRGLEPGVPVAVVGAWGCGSCRRCLDGLETYCERPDLAPVPGGGGGLGMDGGMAEYLLVPAARHVLPLPEGLEPVEAAPLTDAALTPYHAVRRSEAKLGPTATAVVIGVGGLGHMAVQILRATSGARVIAVDPRDAARDRVWSGPGTPARPGPGFRDSRVHSRHRCRRGGRLRGFRRDAGVGGSERPCPRRRHHRRHRRRHATGLVLRRPLRGVGPVHVLGQPT
jgi:propanol-preferring alcohol dehydrogenase